MNKSRPNEYVTRNTLMNLLSDDEIARVSDVETSSCLDQGEEYIDLEQPNQGVRRYGEHAVSMAAVLPRKSITEGTWMRILSLLELAPIPNVGAMDGRNHSTFSETNSGFTTNLK
jgi:hypothetical protein